jgi:hypothetical protein
MYIFRVVYLEGASQGGTGNEAATLAVVPPGTDEPVPLLAGCRIRLGDAYEHQIAIVVWLGEGPDCSSAIRDIYLAIVSTPSLQVQRINSLAAVDEFFFDVRPKWSPEGRYLAFAGSLEGPSQDLYVYDTRTASIARYTTGPHQVEGLQWSPTGDGILHREVDYDRDYSTAHALWWAPLGGGPLIEFRDPDWLGGSLPFYGWLDEDRFLFANQGTQDCLGPLYVGNVRTGDMAFVAEISGCWIESINLGDRAYVLAPTVAPQELTLFRLDGQTATSVVELRIGRDFAYAVGFPGYEFFLIDSDSGLVRLRLNGEWDFLDEPETGGGFRLSPDRSWMVVYEQVRMSPVAIRVFEVLPDGQLVQRSGNLGEASRIGWRPDSRALLLDCDEDATRMAWPPQWVSVRIEGGCPLWEDWSPPGSSSEYVYALLVER